MRLHELKAAGRVQPKLAREEVGSGYWSQNYWRQRYERSELQKRRRCSGLGSRRVARCHYTEEFLRAYKSFRAKEYEVNAVDLNRFEDGTVVDRPNASVRASLSRC